MKIAFDKTAFAIAFTAMATAFSFDEASAQNSRVLDCFVEKITDSPVRFEYTMDMVSDKAPVKASGEVSLQGRCFRMTGNGIESRCDGRTLWTVDSMAKEAYIEDADSAENILLANPLLLITSLMDNMKVVSERTDANTVTVTLRADDRRMDVDEVIIVLSRSGNRLMGAELKKDGTSIVFDIPSFEYVSVSFDPSIFRYGSFGRDWVVTRL